MLDRDSVWQALIPRGWLALGLCVLAYAFVTGNAPTVALAIGIGGLLLSFQGLQKLATSLAALLGAAISWQQVKHLLEAAARHETPGAPEFALRPIAATAKAANQQNLPNVPNMIEAHELAFRYRERGEPVLRNCSLQIRAGDRLLLEGSSGGGKSTLAALLTGLRAPEAGLLLLGGLDQRTLGATGWRKRVSAAPQFHENHVLTGTLAFNLLMGRGWPPAEADLAQAEAVCRGLGLGELLDRMPAGLLQMVGETGWQLSHGERSRLFMARALLQGADLVILDESFGALDPQTLRQCLGYALDHTNTLLVIAHP